MDLAQLSSEITAPGNFANREAWGDTRRLRRIVRGLRAGELVLVEDAMRPAFAEQVYRCLDRARDWVRMQSYDGSHSEPSSHRAFNFHHHNIYRAAPDQPELALAMEAFTHPAARAFAGRLSARPCAAQPVVAANWYRAGDHSTPHSDSLDNRRVAFIWYLARDWRPEWGGALYWVPERRYVVPRFNMLALFVVRPGMDHFVTPVSPFAAGKRLSINGWWRGDNAGAP